MADRRSRRFTSVRIRRRRDIARVRHDVPRPPRDGGGWLPAGFFAALFALAGVAIVLVNSPGEGGATDAEEEPALPSIRAHDSRHHVVFRRTGRTLTIKIGRRAPERLRELRGAVRLECRHLGPGATEATYRRRLMWPEGARFNSLRLPGQAAAAMRECALSRNGRTLARAEFRAG